MGNPAAIAVCAMDGRSPPPARARQAYPRRAAFVSTANESAFCIGAHSATAAGAYHDQAKVAAVLTDLETRLRTRGGPVAA